MEKTKLRKNPSLLGLETLVGEWDVELSNASFLPNKDDTLKGKTRFEWIEGGDFLVMRQGEKAAGGLYANSIIGKDNKQPNYTMLYLDEKASSRVYQMSFGNGQWRQWRDAPGAYQRFTGKISPDGNTIKAKWEFSQDGSHWQHDFDLTYRRKQI